MPTASCCSDGAMLRGAAPFPSYPHEWFVLYRSQSNHGNSIPSYRVGSIQNFSANYVLADSHKKLQAGYYPRNTRHHLRFQ